MLLELCPAQVQITEVTGWNQAVSYHSPFCLTWTLGGFCHWSFILSFSTGYTHYNILVASYCQHLQNDSYNPDGVIMMQPDLYCQLQYIFKVDIFHTEVFIK
jgi:hypothetical protein